MPPPDAPPRRHCRRRSIPPALLTPRAMAALLSIGLSSFERQSAAGRIGPRPLRLCGPKYRRAEVLAWLAHPGPDGELLTATEWAPVWRQLREQAAKHRR